MRYLNLLIVPTLAVLAACSPDIAAPPAVSPADPEVALNLSNPFPDPVGSSARGYGHYCSRVLQPTNSWRLTFGTLDPCTTGLPGAKIMRAGLYSLTGTNRVVAFCQPNYVRYFEGQGTAPMVSARTAAQNTEGRAHSGGCTFTVSPVRMRYFDLPYGSTATFPANYHGSGFDFSRPPYGASQVLDHRGQWSVFIDNHDAHDFGMPKGTPLLAVADGVIITGGMFWGQYTNCNVPGRVEDPTKADCGRQGIVIVKHTFAADLPTYDEVFATGYYHVQRIPTWILNQCTPVDTTQAWPGVGGVCSVPVKRGQVIAYAGRRSTNASHLHFATWRMTNTHGQGHKIGNAALHSPFTRQASMIMEPSGWYGSTPDPWATRAILPTSLFPTGAGTLSIHLWKNDPPIHWQ